jgi:hypothetical protein
LYQAKRRKHIAKNIVKAKKNIVVTTLTAIVQDRCQLLKLYSIRSNCERKILVQISTIGKSIDMKK